MSALRQKRPFAVPALRRNGSLCNGYSDRLNRFGHIAAVDLFPRETPKMRKAAAIAAVTVLLLNGAAAADLNGSVTGASQTDDAVQANWHGGGHRDGGRGHGGGDGGSGDGGSVIIGFPYPSGPDAPYPYPPSPYPYPGSIPPGSPGRPPAAGNSQSRPWPVWYYCDQPSGYYPYVKLCTNDWQRLPVMPPPAGSGPPVADSVWEHCDDPEGYFPYIAQCRHSWVAAVATSPVPGDDPEGTPVIAQWFYCEDAKDYLPYVGSCPHVWRTIPAVPPPNVPLAAMSKTVTDPR